MVVMRNHRYCQFVIDCFCVTRLLLGLKCGKSFGSESVSYVRDTARKVSSVQKHYHYYGEGVNENIDYALVLQHIQRLLRKPITINRVVGPFVDRLDRLTYENDRHDASDSRRLPLEIFAEKFLKLYNRISRSSEQQHNHKDVNTPADYLQVDNLLLPLLNILLGSLHDQKCDVNCVQQVEDSET